MAPSLPSPRPRGRGARRWLVLGGPPELEAARSTLAFLADIGPLDVVVLGGDVPPWLADLGCGARPLGRGAGSLLGVPGTARLVAAGLRSRNAWLGELVRRADAVVPLTALGATLTDGAATTPERFEERAVDPQWRSLGKRLDALLGTREGADLPMRTAREVARVLLDAGAPRVEQHAEVVAKAARAVFRLVRVEDLLDAALLLDLVRLAEPRVRTGLGPVLDVLDLAVAVRRGAEVDPVVVHAATSAALRLADDSVDPDTWLLATNAALDVHFHRRLHVVAASSPLVDDPAWWAAPVAASALVRAADSPVRAVAAEGPDPVHVAYLPGTFDRHATSVLDVLASDEHVGTLDVVRLGSGAASGLRPVPRVVAGIRDGVGGAELAALMRLEPEDVDRVAAADVVVADWADMGAVWASRAARPGARVVVRAHSADVLSAAVHLLDWGRVTDVVVVAEHVRDVLVELLGARCAHVRVHVVPVVVPVATVADAPPRDPHLVVMTGWAQQVKDPAFALDAIERLRTDDPRWRLRLVGARVADATVEREGDEGEWGRALTARVAAAEADGWLEVTGQVEDVPRRLADAGHVLNTSLREGCPTAVIEGVWAGCLPVVRDWPLYAARGGAARTLPHTRVVATAEEAARALAEHADLLTSDAGDAERAAVGAAYARRFAPERTAAAWRALVAGTTAGAAASVR